MTFPLDPAKRIYWACLLTSLVLASLVVTLRTHRFDPREQLRSLFDRRYWMHRGTLVDVGLLFLNNGVRMLVLIPFVGGQLGATLVVGRFLQTHVGDVPPTNLPWLVIAVIYSVTAFVAEDASRFFLHLAMHRSRLLWRFHRIHHGVRTLTPLTLFRVHPVEHLLYFFRGVVVFGTVSGFFIWLFGRELTALDILGVGLFGFLFNLAGANLRHSHVWVSFGRLERWFVSPAQHQLHHSRHHSQANLGSAFAIWDRWMGTWLLAGAPQTLSFGVPDIQELRGASRVD